MIKKLFFIVGILFLTACTPSQKISVNDSEKDFQRKIECAKYVKDAEKKVEEYGKEISGEKNISWPNMEKVFYSPKVNSCLFVWSNNMMEIKNGKSHNRVDRGVNDILSGEEIVREIYIEGDSSLGNENEMTERFSQKLHALE